MFAVITCLEQHDPRQLVWAVLICVISAGAGLSAYRRARQARGLVRHVWLAMLAFLLGAGVWATHFMAMLAFQRHTPAAFEFQGTVVSLVTASVGFLLGGGVAAYSSGRLGRALGGGVCGLAIAAMHFIGVAAMRLPAQIAWDPVLVGTAILIGVTGAAASLTVAGDFKRRSAGFAAAALLVAAICGLHFTAMAAAKLTPAPFAYPPGFYSREGLGLAVGLLVGVILISGAGVLLMDGVGKATALSALRASLNKAPCAIGFFDASYRLIFWNESFADFLRLYGLEPRIGLDHDTALAQAVAMGLPSCFVESDPRSVAPGCELRFEPFQAPNGRWFESRAGTSRDGGLVGLITDVTAQRELMAQQDAARAQAEQVSRAKSEFLANTSHEIRTPLNALLGMVQVMERNHLDPDQRQRLQLVAESGRSLLAVLNSVLDLAKIEAGKFELDEHPFDLAATVRAAVSGFESLAAQKELRLAVEIAPEAAGVWRGDGDRLRQVLCNLVSNAVKFTPQGHVAVRVERAEAGLRFCVEDSGIGVAPEKQELIFGAFEQADASTTRQFGGTGLGLAICANIVRSMGGRITLDSAPGEGSSFGFTVPMTPLEAATAPLARTDASGDVEELPLRILVAEDNPNNQLVLSALLEPFGVDLTMTADGQAAVEAFAAGVFDVVLMDAQMPRMNGVEAAMEIRRIEAERGHGRIRIIALTANVMNHQVQEYLAAGMDDFLAKPIQLAELVRALSVASGQSASAAA
ncbi:MAG TPA: ATP-binding protein [Phenylobacterium sp.]|uniref:ATP-binding protein n=1 Tax=Phenylobacterium sp. TaxID=1871053 RepID=UPI002B4A9B67|nr:ATP-binding protein [Phenylobacterium sp.]HKR88519.1 ATP-binding protein [Phenylobacterium sp.]